MHDIEQRHVRKHRRQRRVLADLGVRHADVLGHQERGRAHHRRHDLAIDAGGGFDRAGLLRRIADPLHQRDRERAAGHDVGHRRARDHAHHPRGDDRGLGRAAAHVAQKRERDLDEVIAGAGFFQQGAEQHEQEDVARRHAEGDAEHAFGRQPVVRDCLGQRHALVRDDIRHPRAGKRVAQHQRGDDRERRTDHAPGGLEQQQHADDRGDEIDLRRLSGTRRQVAIEQEQVRAAERRHQRKHPVRHRNPVPRRGLGERIGEVGAEQRQRQMQRAHLRVVENEDAEGERQRRRVPELQQRPADAGRRQNQARRPDGLAPAEVGLRDQFADVDRLGHLIQPFSR